MKRVSIIIAGAALAASAAFAQGPGYGPGGRMMGGYGPGQGMMGGYGPGGGFAGLDLSDEQQDKIFAIREEHRRKNWDTMGALRAEQFKLRRLYNSDNVDAKAFGEQQKKVDELRRQMVGSHLEVRNQISAVLTPEQRKQFRQIGPGWMRELEQE
jgi:Spy/CpxP family protein refolding chaperone